MRVDAYVISGGVTIEGVTRPVTMDASVEGAGEDP
jgi:polyisoprenoid-binding protein YceI